VSSQGGYKGFRGAKRERSADAADEVLSDALPAVHGLAAAVSTGDMPAAEADDSAPLSKPLPAPAARGAAVAPSSSASSGSGGGGRSGQHSSALEASQVGSHALTSISGSRATGDRGLSNPSEPAGSSVASRDASGAVSSSQDMRTPAALGGSTSQEVLTPVGRPQGASSQELSTPRGGAGVFSSPAAHAEPMSQDLVTPATAGALSDSETSTMLVAKSWRPGSSFLASSNLDGSTSAVHSAGRSYSAALSQSAARLRSPTRSPESVVLQPSPSAHPRSADASSSGPGSSSHVGAPVATGESSRLKLDSSGALVFRSATGAAAAPGASGDTSSSSHVPSGRVPSAYRCALQAESLASGSQMRDSQMRDAPAAESGSSAGWPAGASAANSAHGTDAPRGESGASGSAVMQAEASSSPLGSSSTTALKGHSNALSQEHSSPQAGGQAPGALGASATPSDSAGVAQASNDAAGATKSFAGGSSSLSTPMAGSYPEAATGTPGDSLSSSAFINAIAQQHPPAPSMVPVEPPVMHSGEQALPAAADELAAAPADESLPSARLPSRDAGDATPPHIDAASRAGAGAPFGASRPPEPAQHAGDARDTSSAKRSGRSTTDSGARLISDADFETEDMASLRREIGGSIISRELPQAGSAALGSAAVGSGAMRGSLSRPLQGRESLPYAGSDSLQRDAAAAAGEGTRVLQGAAARDAAPPAPTWTNDAPSRGIRGSVARALGPAQMYRAASGRSMFDAPPTPSSSSDAPSSASRHHASTGVSSATAKGGCQSRLTHHSDGPSSGEGAVRSARRSEAPASGGRSARLARSSEGPSSLSSLIPTPRSRAGAAEGVSDLSSASGAFRTARAAAERGSSMATSASGALPKRPRAPSDQEDTFLPSSPSFASDGCTPRSGMAQPMSARSHGVSARSARSKEARTDSSGASHSASSVLSAAQPKSANSGGETEQSERLQPPAPAGQIGEPAVALGKTDAGHASTALQPSQQVTASLSNVQPASTTEAPAYTAPVDAAPTGNTSSSNVPPAEPSATAPVAQTPAAPLPPRAASRQGYIPQPPAHRGPPLKLHRTTESIQEDAPAMFSALSSMHSNDVGAAAPPPRAPSSHLRTHSTLSALSRTGGMQSDADVAFVSPDALGGSWQQPADSRPPSSHPSSFALSPRGSPQTSESELGPAGSSTVLPPTTSRIPRRSDKLGAGGVQQLRQRSQSVLPQAALSDSAAQAELDRRPASAAVVAPEDVDVYLAGDPAAQKGSRLQASASARRASHWASCVLFVLADESCSRSQASCLQIACLRHVAWLSCHHVRRHQVCWPCQHADPHALVPACRGGHECNKHFWQGRATPRQVLVTGRRYHRCHARRQQPARQRWRRERRRAAAARPVCLFFVWPSRQRQRQRQRPQGA
jgi:hypothetical protein